MMLSKSLASFGLLFGAAAVSTKSPSKRATSSDFALYAYGTNVGIGGLPLYYSGGYAYIGAQLGNDTTANVTFSMSSTSVRIVGSNSTGSESNSTSNIGKYLVINTSGNDDITFVSSPSSNQTSTGFRLFSSFILWDLQSSFYAAPTGTDGVWKVQWLSDTGSAGDSVAVALKKDAPGVLAKTT